MTRPILALTLAGVAILLLAYASLATRVVGAECAGQVVWASWYGTESGNRTANGERFDGRSLTAAHRTLPFGTKLRVTYGGKSVVVRVNDRGPWVRGRSLDLSRAAAERIGLIRAGVGRVCISRVLDTQERPR